jgi:hypothetical protein
MMAVLFLWGGAKFFVVLEVQLFGDLQRLCSQVASTLSYKNSSYLTCLTCAHPPRLCVFLNGHASQLHLYSMTFPASLGDLAAQGSVSSYPH